jgi:phosphotriesterase-related protein
MTESNGAKPYPVGMAMTVLGPVPLADLGITLPHEHIFLDLSCWWSHPKKSDREHLIDMPVESIPRELLIGDPYHTRDNLLLTDQDLAVAELMLFRNAGGRSVVDLSTRTIGPYPERLKAVAEKTGLNIIAATGFYVKRAHGAMVANASQEELAEGMIKELTSGFKGTDIKAGLIGEIGTSSPVDPDEAKVLRAAAAAHAKTGAAINIHLSIFAREGNNVLDLLENCGVAPQYVALSHLDELPDAAYHTSLARRGCFVEFDCFGSECRFDEDDCAEPTDEVRITRLLDLLEKGFEKQLLISQDICTKMQLRHYGGNGYDHVLRSIVPELLRRGVSETTIHQILVENPANFLAGNTAIRPGSAMQLADQFSRAHA